MITSSVPRCWKIIKTSARSGGTAIWPPVSLICVDPALRTTNSCNERARPCRPESLLPLTNRQLAHLVFRDQPQFSQFPLAFTARFSTLPTTCSPKLCEYKRGPDVSAPLSAPPFSVFQPLWAGHNPMSHKPWLIHYPSRKAQKHQRFCSPRNNFRNNISNC